MDIVRRGRNAHPHTVPKNADIGQYHLATGFEALIGFLHLSDQKERLNILLERSVEIGEKLYGITRE
jgi:ribonuclease-3 family protein